MGETVGSVNDSSDNNNIIKLLVWLYNVSRHGFDFQLSTVISVFINGNNVDNNLINRSVSSYIF